MSAHKSPKARSIDYFLSLPQPEAQELLDVIRYLIRKKNQKPKSVPKPREIKTHAETA